MGQGAEDCEAWEDARVGYYELREVMFGDRNRRQSSNKKQMPTKVEAMNTYQHNKDAKVGTEICCPICRTKFTKNSYQQAFCKNKTKGKSSCKDVFWNYVDAERNARKDLWQR